MPTGRGEEKGSTEEEEEEEEEDARLFMKAEGDCSQQRFYASLRLSRLSSLSLSLPASIHAQDCWGSSSISLSLSRKRHRRDTAGVGRCSGALRRSYTRWSREGEKKNSNIYVENKRFGKKNISLKVS